MLKIYSGVEGSNSPPDCVQRFFQFLHNLIITDVMGKKNKKPTNKTVINMGGKSKTIEVDAFQPSGHISYTGFGVHEDKSRKSERRMRKIEENRAKYWGDNE